MIAASLRARCVAHSPLSHEGHSSVVSPVMNDLHRASPFLSKPLVCSHVEICIFCQICSSCIVGNSCMAQPRPCCP